MRTHNIPLCCRKLKKISLLSLPTLTGLNCPCLELIFMVPKVFESLEFECSSSSFISFSGKINACHNLYVNVYAGHFVNIYSLLVRS